MEEAAIGQATAYPTIALVGAIMFFAGFVKGAIGFGMPLVAVPLLASLIELRLAAALMTFPLLVANLWVGLEGGQFWSITKRYWAVMLSLGAGIFAGSWLLVGIDQRIMLVILGLVVLGFATLDRLKGRFRPVIPERLAQRYGIVAGASGGLIGGISTVFGPPLILYLAALRLPRDDFARINSAVFFFGSLCIFVAFASSRVLTPTNALWSAACVLPILLGVHVGGRVRLRTSQRRFETLVAIGLLMLGFNLIRRGFAQ